MKIDEKLLKTGKEIKIIFKLVEDRRIPGFKDSRGQVK